MRRLVSLLSGLLLLHLTLVGVELTCTKHGLEHNARSSHGDMAAHHPDHAAQQAAAGDRSDTSGNTPIVPACCKAFASCGTTPLDDPSERARHAVVVGAFVRALADAVPTSWSAEPDSPPPKA